MNFVNLFNMKKLSILLVFALVFTACGGQPAAEDPEITKIAQCLADKGAKMYGAVWCGHCANQKKAFGEAFELINYVECDANTDLEGAKECVEKKIMSVPAWDIPGQDLITGEHTPEELAELAGC